jgi:hypothetical protein
VAQRDSCNAISKNNTQRVNRCSLLIYRLCFDKEKHGHKQTSEEVHLHIPEGTVAGPDEQAI